MKLTMPAYPLVFSKGAISREEEYSAFDAKDQTGRQLEDVMKELGTRRILIGGLATDYCVLNSASDLQKAGYRIIILTDACCAINAVQGDGEKALATLAANDAQLTTTKALAP